MTKGSYINAHGTATQGMLFLETQAIKKVFSDCATIVTVSSTKSMSMATPLEQHGAIDIIVSMLAIKINPFPRQLTWTNLTPECDLNYVPNIRQRRGESEGGNIKFFRFWGTNAVLIPGKVEEYSRDLISWGTHVGFGPNRVLDGLLFLALLLSNRGQHLCFPVALKAPAKGWGFSRP